ncbi:MAG: hypothetical protein R3F19_04890 [Verrucomicrobiales bacterium]
MIEFWRYQLQPVASLNAKTGDGLCEGVLIRVGGGHGCVHPWTSLGDEPLSEQLHLLAIGKPTALGERALQCCAIDAAARAEKRSLFRGLKVPRSHVTVTEVDALAVADLASIRAAGFDCVKIKLGADAERGACQINALADRWRSSNPPVRIRLDFNGTLNPDGLRRFSQRLRSHTSDLIDFVEDPFPYEPLLWQQLQLETGLRFALDRNSERFAADPAFPVRVWKPTCSPPPISSSSERLVITSCMDHAIGQLFAAYEASVFPGEVDTCGLLTHPLFCEDPFFRQLRIEDARLVPPPGPGLGFGAMLAVLPWKALT